MYYQNGIQCFGELMLNHTKIEFLIGVNEISNFFIFSPNTINTKKSKIMFLFIFFRGWGGRVPFSIQAAFLEHNTQYFYFKKTIDFKSITIILLIIIK